MIVLEKNNAASYEGYWTRNLQEMTGLVGNKQPPLPHATAVGTLRAVEYVKPLLLAYQREGAESGALDGDVWKITVSAEDLSLDQAKAQALSEIASTRYAVETGGVVVAGKFYSTGRDSQAAIARATGTVDWKCNATVTRDMQQQLDGPTVATVCVSDVEFASSDMDAVKTAVEAHVAAAYAREAELMAGINAADSVAALRAIDLTTGWAAVPPRA
jgi:outer membrane protein assembly factor BamB